MNNSEENTDVFQQVWENIWELEQNISANKKCVTLELTDITTDYRILVTIIGIFVVIINMPIVISSGWILKKGQSSKNTYMLLGNISLADLITGFLLGFSQLFQHLGVSKIRCYIAMFLYPVCSVTSVSCLLYISIDRYLFIAHGLKYKTWVQPNTIRRAILSSWIWGLLHGTLATVTLNPLHDNPFPCIYLRVVPPRVILFTSSVGIFGISSAVLVYLTILYHAIKRVVVLKKMEREPEDPNKLRAFRGGKRSEEYSPMEVGKSIFFIKLKKNPPKTYITEANSPSTWRAIKVVFFTVGGFTVTWFPYYITSIMYVMCDPEQDYEKCKSLLYAVYYPLTILAMTNCVLNPLIYAWWHRDFRNSVKKMWSINIRKLGFFNK